MSHRRVRACARTVSPKLDKLVDQVVGTAVEVRCGEPGEDGIERRIASWGVADNPDAIEITVEAPLQAQFHDRSAQKSGTLILERNIHKSTVLVLQRQKEEFLWNSQHGLAPTKVSRRPMQPRKSH